MATRRKTKAESAEHFERIMIERVIPEVDGGRFPVKRVPGETVEVEAHAFSDGHDDLLVFLLYRKAGAALWSRVPMVCNGNDEWRAAFSIKERADHEYTVEAEMDEFATWQKGLRKKQEAGQDLSVDLQIGAGILKKVAASASEEIAPKLTAWARELEASPDQARAVARALAPETHALVVEGYARERFVRYPHILKVAVDRPRALFSSWYEFFPRSWGDKPGEHGSFRTCQRILPEIARMGFNVIYLPPIHPIGVAHRKGKNNSTTCLPGEPGCPWAIGSEEGGHKTIHPQLGTIEDFKAFLSKAAGLGLEVALDVAFQCSPDHPYVKAHPQWFLWRPDGTVQYAENPPKKYEDVLPINFETEDREALWQELKSVFLFWIEQGVRIFRVDNPHTKPFMFWDWVIAEIRKDHPDVIFLAEAFTRPKVMYRLAKAGFTQSYTYFTWRNNKHEFMDYMNEIARGPVAEFFRPNFWPNTPDILVPHLQTGGRPMFIMRAVLASTLSSNWGVYGPAFELCLNEPFPGKEEYIYSEKYEIKSWDWDAPGNLKDTLALLNRIRRDNAALQETRNIRFLEVYNDQLLAYWKASSDGKNVILVVASFDPVHAQGGRMRLPLKELGLSGDAILEVQDLLTGMRQVWRGEFADVHIDPRRMPAQVLRVEKK